MATEAHEYPVLADGRWTVRTSSWVATFELLAGRVRSIRVDEATCGDGVERGLLVTDPRWTSRTARTLEHLLGQDATALERNLRGHFKDLSIDGPLPRGA